MTYLALSSNVLSRLYYHVIWGLRVETAGINAHNLYQEALLLHSNTAERQRIINQVDSFLQRRGVLGWFIRGFYWLFNWEQYRTNYYTLQGYFSWRIYEEGLTMLSKQEQNQVKETGGFLLEPSPQHYSIVNALAQGAGRIGASVRDTFHSAIASWELWTTRTVLSSALEKKELAPVTLNTSKTHFQVNEAMMPALNCLGIDAVTGEYILFSALKSAYRTSRLRTHPDRAHGNHDEFILIQSAYEELTDLIEAASDSFEMSAELKKYFSDLDDKIDEVKSVYQDLRSDMDGLNQRVDGFVQRADEHTQRVDGFVQRADEHTQRVAAHCEQHAKDMHELTNKMSILKATLKANGYDLDAEENNDSNDENKASSSQASNPHRLFTPSTVNSGSSSSNDRLNSDDLANANK